MTAAQWAGFLVAAAVGAPARYLVDARLQRRNTRLPLGTLTVNVVGSLILGVLTGLVLYHGMDAGVRTVLGTGAMGAFTTFSAFSFETVRLAESGDLHSAGRNIAANVACSVGAAALGLWLTGLL
jgi:CrcB protein